MFNKTIVKSISSLKFILPFLFIAFIIGCGDDSNGNSEDLRANFQFEVDASNALTIKFTNFSQNANSYSWDFGDGNSSTEESPTHTYAAGGTYDVVLTASNGSDSDDALQSVTVMDPNQMLTTLAGTVSKTWYLQRDGIAMGVGPTINDNEFWSFGGVTPLGDRPCILDDSYTFFRDGRFEANTNGTVFVDSEGNGGWKRVEGCFDELNPDAFVHFSTGEDLSAFANGGDYTYTLNDDQITINGLGSYIGLPVKTNSGDNYLPIEEKRYEIFNIVDGNGIDTLQIALTGSNFSWNFYLVSYENAGDIPAIPASAPRADFNFSRDQLSVSFASTSTNAASYQWDFGDGGTSTESDPSHTYGSTGDYQVTLTVMDNSGTSNMITKEVSVSDVPFSVGLLSNTAGKVWRLAGEGSYKVGSGPNMGDFWSGPDAAVTLERACQMDDEFILSDDGTFVIDVKDEVWAEPYMGGSNACMSPDDLVAPFDVFGGGTFSFEAVEGSPSTIKVIGTGAYLGFNKAFNEGELTNDALGFPASEITYDVIDFVSTDSKDEIVVAVDYVGDGCCYWTMILVSEK